MSERRTIMWPMSQVLDISLAKQPELKTISLYFRIKWRSGQYNIRYASSQSILKFKGS